MIPRAVLAAVLATALLGVALPAVDDARVESTDRVVGGELDRIERAAGSMLAADEAAPTRGARRVVVVRVPAAAWSRAGLDYIAVGGSPGGAGPEAAQPSAPGRVVYRIAGRPERVVRLPVPLVAAGDRPLVLREPGTHRLVLRVARRGNRTVVLVGRAGTHAGRRSVEPEDRDPSLARSGEPDGRSRSGTRSRNPEGRDPAITRPGGADPDVVRPDVYPGGGDHRDP